MGALRHLAARVGAAAVVAHPVHRLVSLRRGAAGHIYLTPLTYPALPSPVYRLVSP